MKYFKTTQFIPAKGEAFMYYECDDAEKVLRMLTHVPGTGETTRTPNPIVKRLVMRERLLPADAAEFARLWGP